MLAGLTTNVELLMLALDVLVEAEQLVSSTAVVLLVVAVLPVELVCVCLHGHGTYFVLTIYPFSSKLNDQQLRLATYGPLMEFPRESNS